jgi:hypothetical protein
MKKEYLKGDKETKFYTSWVGRIMDIPTIPPSSK